MKLEQFATELVAKDRFVKASFGGFAGSGKTTTASDFIIGAYHDMKLTKPILLIDNEKGSRFLIPKFQQAGIKCLVKDTVQLADVLQAMAFLNDKEIDFVFVDTMTKVYYKYIIDYKAKNRITFMTLEHWGKILPAWQEEFADKFVACNGNFVFTGRGGFQYEKEEDTVREDGTTKKGAFVKSGVKMKLAGETPFEPDLNVWMELEQDVTSKGIEVWRTAQVMKDRNNTSTSIDGRVFKNPTYKDFQPIIQFLMQMPVGEVAGETNTTNLAPSEDFGWQERKKAKEIELEKIQGAFDLAALPKTDAGKKLKAMINKKIFGTTSMTEFEKLTPDGMRFAREQLETLFSKMAGIDPSEVWEFVENYNVEKESANA
jgi:hypothetical protein